MGKKKGSKSGKRPKSKKELKKKKKATRALTPNAAQLHNELRVAIDTCDLKKTRKLLKIANTRNLENSLVTAGQLWATTNKEIVIVVKMIELLIWNGARLGAHHEPHLILRILLYLKRGQLPPHYSDEVYFQRVYRVIETLLRHGIFPPNSALLEAVSISHVTVVQLLIEYGHDPTFSDGILPSAETVAKEDPLIKMAVENGLKLYKSRLLEKYGQYALEVKSRICCIPWIGELQLSNDLILLMTQFILSDESCIMCRDAGNLKASSLASLSVADALWKFRVDCQSCHYGGCDRCGSLGHYWVNNEHCEMHYI